MTDPVDCIWSWKSIDIPFLNNILMRCLSFSDIFLTFNFCHNERNFYRRIPVKIHSVVKKILRKSFNFEYQSFPFQFKWNSENTTLKIAFPWKAYLIGIFNCTHFVQKCEWSEIRSSSSSPPSSYDRPLIIDIF